MPNIDVNGGRIPALAVVGTRDGAVISHVAILKDDVSPTSGDNVDVWHTGPPTKLGSCEIHVAGHLDDLTPEEQAALIHEAEDTIADTPTIVRPGRGMSRPEIEQHMKRQFLTHYSILPPIRAVRDKVTDVFRHYRLSCAGFVSHCYEQGLDIQLVVDQTQLPVVTWDALNRVYGTQIDRLTNDEINELGLRRQRITIEAGLGWQRKIVENITSWPILMPSYLIESVARDSRSIRASAFQPT